MEIEKALLDPLAYPFKTKKIDLIQTHISWVFLTEKYAFKVKKPVNFGFLDFSSLGKRKFYCQQELKLNQRLSPQIYLKIIPIKKYGDKVRLAGKGRIIDWALMMRKFPQNKIMDKLLDRNEISSANLKKLAEILSSFHRKAKTNKKYGQLKTICYNWDENFQQTENYVGKIILKNDFNLIRKNVSSFIERNKSLFLERVKENKIKWCHGDLHSGNIFIDKDKIYVFDCIEFNERFAVQDTASDIAFLIMDLELHQKKPQADFFLKSYLKESRDKEMPKLLDFYKCYRAFVRGKVNSFQNKEKEAKNYFNLALAYAKSLA